MASNLRVDSIVPATGTNVSIGTATGGVNIPGVLTYEDVTNVDSVGVITARSDINLGDSIIHIGDTNTKIRFPAADTITAETSGSERLRLDSSGRVLIGTQSTSDNAFLVVKGNVTGGAQQGEMVLLNGAGNIDQNFGLGQISFGGGTGDQISSKIQGFADHDWNTGGDTSDSPGRIVFFTTPDGSATPTEKLRISSEGYITKPLNPVFHAFGGPNLVNANNDIVFGQERFDIGGGYNTSNGVYTAPVTGYYHFYTQVYRQDVENDTFWGFYLDNGSGYSQISEARLQTNYGGDSGRGYCTLQSSIYWYMSAGHKIKCRVGNGSGNVHCNNTLSYFCGNLVG